MMLFDNSTLQMGQFELSIDFDCVLKSVQTYVASQLITNRMEIGSKRLEWRHSAEKNVLNNGIRIEIVNELVVHFLQHHQSIFQYHKGSTIECNNKLWNQLLNLPKAINQNQRLNSPL